VGTICEDGELLRELTLEPDRLYLELLETVFSKLSTMPGETSSPMSRQITV